MVHLFDQTIVKAFGGADRILSSSVCLDDPKGIIAQKESSAYYKSVMVRYIPCLVEQPDDVQCHPYEEYSKIED